MRIDVEAGGFTDAADACRAANQMTAMMTESLSGKLTAFAGMAGDDASSAEFAVSYDDAACESMRTLAEMTEAFTGLARLLLASGDNHGRAESASAGTTSYSGGSLSEDDFVRVRCATPPSSLGGTPPDLGTVEAWILDQVQGFVWPNADVDRLLDAALVWRRAAGSVADLEGNCDVALTHLERQRSPEVPLARDALDELRTLVVETTEGLTALAAACEEYADAVRAAHERTLSLLSEIAQMIMEGVALTALVGAFTGGLGTGAAGAAAVARIAAHAPRFHALLITLRASSAVLATRLRSTREGVVAVRARAEKFARARVRDERGSIRLLSLGRVDFPRGWLRGHEVPPGHALRDHVGDGVEELFERCITQNKKVSSSFQSETEAEDLIARVLRSRHAEISAWLENGTTKALAVSMDLGVQTGLSVTKAGHVLHPTGVRVVLIPTANRKSGWQVLTAYPN